MLARWCSAHWRAMALATIAVVALLVVGWRLRLRQVSLARTFRIGFQNSPPYHFPDAQGKPTGPAVELIQEAANRKNIRLEWVFSPQGPEAALESQALDLWPIVGDLPERRPKMYISAP